MALGSFRVPWALGVVDPIGGPASAHSKPTLEDSRTDSEAWGAPRALPEHTRSPPRKHMEIQKACASHRVRAGCVCYPAMLQNELEGPRHRGNLHRAGLNVKNAIRVQL